MLFTLICKDKPASLDLRLATRPAHVEFLNGLNGSGKLKMAGPLLDEAGKPFGSLVIIDAADKAEATATAARDPYALAGLFASVEIAAFNWAFNAPGA